MRLKSIRWPNLKYKLFNDGSDEANVARISYMILIVCLGMGTCTWTNCDPEQSEEQKRETNLSDFRSDCLSTFHDKKQCSVLEFEFTHNK